jgi:cell division septum initiation protein DivIVA
MNLFGRLKAKKFSERSQASYQREERLREQLFAVQRRISYTQSGIGDWEKEIEWRTKSAALGNSNVDGAIPELLQKIRRNKDYLEILERQGKKLQVEIDCAAKVSPEEAKARADEQLALAKLALERLECDRMLDNAIRTAKCLLEKRGAMTDRMLGLVRRIEFTLGFDGLDKDRFDTLEKSLPGDLAARSEVWVDWLLGDNRKSERYSVLDETIFFGETLASANVFRRGEEVTLTVEELAEISATEESRVAYPSEPIPGGGFRAGSRVEIHNPRVEKVVGAGQ